MHYKVNFQKAKRNYMVLTFEVEEGKGRRTQSDQSIVRNL